MLELATLSYRHQISKSKIQKIMSFVRKFLPQHIASLAYRQITGNGPKVCYITKVYYRRRRCCLTNTMSLLSINLKNTILSSGKLYVLYPSH